MTRHGGDCLVDCDNDVFTWSNESPLPTRNQEKCKSTRWFHLSNPTIAIWCFLLLSSFVSLTIYLSLRQHMNGPGIIWPEVMVNMTTNSTTYATTDVKLPYQRSHHSWQYNTLILRAWLGTCFGVGSFIGFTLVLLVCHFLWKKRQQALKNHCKVREETNYDERDMEMRGRQT